MMNKKGAMELSINTIIVIVIGVALLSFGLLFLNNIRENIMSLSDDSFIKANEALDNLDSYDQRLTVPSMVKVEKNDHTNFAIIIGNENQEDGIFNVTIKPALGNNAGNKFRMIVPASDFTIQSGLGKKLNVVVVAAKSAVKGSYPFSVQVKVDGEDYETTEFFVNVE